MRTRQEAVCHSRERCWGQRKQGGMDRGQAKLSLVTQLYLTLYDPMDCSLPSSSVHGDLQARILEWATMPSSRDLSNPENEPRSPALQADSLPTIWATREALAKVRVNRKWWQVIWVRATCCLSGFWLQQLDFHNLYTSRSAWPPHLPTVLGKDLFRSMEQEDGPFAKEFILAAILTI